MTRLSKHLISRLHKLSPTLITFATFCWIAQRAKVVFCTLWAFKILSGMCWLLTDVSGLPTKNVQYGIVISFHYLQCVATLYCMYNELPHCHIATLCINMSMCYAMCYAMSKVAMSKNVFVLCNTKWRHSLYKELPILVHLPLKWLVTLTTVLHTVPKIHLLIKEFYDHRLRGSAALL